MYEHFRQLKPANFQCHIGVKGTISAIFSNTLNGQKSHLNQWKFKKWPSFGKSHCASVLELSERVLVVNFFKLYC